LTSRKASQEPQFVAIIGRETQDADTKIDFWCIDDGGT
jgi:tellurite resistance-related uncharacterized protein